MNRQVQVLIVIAFFAAAAIWIVVPEKSWREVSQRLGASPPESVHQQTGLVAMWRAVAHPTPVTPSTGPYDIAKRNGQNMDACVQAGIAAAGSLQAGDEAEYTKWKRIEKTDCKLAGL